MITRWKDRLDRQPDANIVKKRLAIYETASDKGDAEKQNEHNLRSKPVTPK